jgi:hypothetical protein
VLLEALLITQALAGPASVHVGIRGPEDRSLPGVLVEMRGAGGHYRAVSNSEGAAILNAPPGDYKVKIALEGFETRKLRVSVVAGRTTDLAVELGFAPPPRGVVQFNNALRSIDFSSSTTESNFWLQSGYSVRY